MKKLLLNILIILTLAFFTDLHPSKAQSGISVTNDQVDSNYPTSPLFHLSAKSSAEIQEVTLRYRTSGETCQSALAEQEVDITAGTSVDAEWEWDFTRSGVLPPGVEVYWQWEIGDAAGNSMVTDEQTYQVNDTRHTWNLLSDDQVNLQWYQGSRSFGLALQEIANQSLDRLEQHAGVSPSGEIWITIYPTAEELKEVDIHTYEWAGGIAYPEFNSTIMAIGTDELSWAESVIPHELAHLVTESVIFNCKGMWLPTWLSEGLALYAEGEINPYYVDRVDKALEDDELPALRTLESGFSSNSDAANLSYGHSGMVTTYMIDQFGAEKMADLLAEIKSGNKIDKALQAVYEMDTDGLEAGWRISLGYSAQPTLAPTNANRTAVPTMALWTSAVRPTETPTSEPSLTPTLPAPTQTPEPIPSETLASAEISSAPTPGDSSTNETSSQRSTLPIIIGGVLVLIVGGVVSAVLITKKRRTL